MSTSFYLFNKIGVYRLIILVDSHKTTTIINAHHNHHYSKLTKNEEHFQNYVCSSGHLLLCKLKSLMLQPTKAALGTVAPIHPATPPPPPLESPLAPPTGITTAAAPPTVDDNN